MAESSKAADTDQANSIEGEGRTAADHRSKETVLALTQRYQAVQQGLFFKKTAYFFRNDNGNIAFVDHGKKLTTVRTDKVVIETMVAVGKVKGWRQITASGSAEFRAAVLREARRHGLDVAGHTPEIRATEPVVKSLARVREPNTPSILSEREQIAVATLERILKDRGDSAVQLQAVIDGAQRRLRSRDEHLGFQRVRQQPRVEIYDKMAPKPKQTFPTPMMNKVPQHRDR